MKKFQQKIIRAVAIPASPHTRLVGYARVSTDDQSLDLQIEALTRAGVQPDNIHSETRSGISVKRPALEAALLDCREGDTLVVWKFDRMGRSMRDLLNQLHDLERRKIGFRSLTEGVDTTTPVGRFTVHLLGALAQFERDLIVERTRAGMRVHMAKGGKIGAPRQFTDDKVKEARKMKREGASYAAIANHFGFTTFTVKRYINMKR
jgi:DNA invertase Pin-like site-specific DNA recombinase